jgi:hypothetical protein
VPAHVDWSQPWYTPWRSAGEAVAARLDAAMPLPDALNAQGGSAPVLFVPQGELPVGLAYEQVVFDTGRCPVRPGLHDFFNGLVWLQFPQTKRALNRLQAQAIAQGGVAGRRGPVRDAVTVFDENGALLQAPPALWDALLAREWRRLFVDLRPLWAQARLLIFGHALLEQLATPRKGLSAHVWCAPAALETPEAADAWLAAQCTAQALAAKPFTPLPVLGVPGWHPENTNFSFYDDSHVFRPRKTTQQQSGQTAFAPARS